MPIQEKHFCLNFDQAIFNLAKFFKIKALQCLIFNQILTIIFQSNFNYPCCLVVWYRQQSAFIFKKNDESIHSHAEPDLSEELEPWIDVEGGRNGEAVEHTQGWAGRCNSAQLLLLLEEYTT